MAKKKKKKLLIAGLTGCEGCEFETLDLGERFVALMDEFEVAEFKLIEEEPANPPYDLAVVEGNPLLNEEIKHLRQIRKQSKFLVALGACACSGSIQEIKNYRQKKKLMEYVYPKYSDRENLTVYPLRKYVRVDLEIPGCPPEKEQIWDVMRALKQGIVPAIPDRPVCFECQTRGYECLLQKGELCLGPITVGGCEAICLGSAYRCEGCRGPLKDPQAKNHLEDLRVLDKEEILDEILQKYGMKDDLEKKDRA